MITNKTKWLLAGLLCLVLWPGAIRAQSPALDEAFNQFVDLYTLSPLRRQNPREEPGALAAHAGICAGGTGKPVSLPRPFG